jgi:hypothetical protein
LLSVSGGPCPEAAERCGLGEAEEHQWAPTHADYRFSITIHTDYPSVVGCLRALSQFSQQSGNVRIPSGGTKEPDWEGNDHKVTFRFTSPAYRQGFVEEAERVLRPGLWQEVGRSDCDPATPQSE